MRVTDSYRFEIYKNSLGTLKGQLDKLGQEISIGKEDTYTLRRPGRNR